MNLIAQRDISSDSKAAHNSVKQMFRVASHRRLRLIQLRYGAQDQVSLSHHVPPGFTVFTFVREPLGGFMSGYAETVHRVTTFGGARSVRSADTTYTNVDCHSHAANESRFAAFVTDLLRCRSMGYDTYHIWPQVMKLDVLPSYRPFDFIGRVENLAEDWQVLMRILGTKPSRMASTNSATHNVDKCGKQISVPSPAKLAVLPILCDLLRVDYECLGYRPPAVCHTTASAARDESRACSITATQAAVLDRVRSAANGARPPAAIASQALAPDEPAGTSPGCKDAVGVALHTTGGTCFQAMTMRPNIRAHNDYSFRLRNVPRELEGELFIRAPHRITRPAELVLQCVGRVQSKYQMVVTRAQSP